MKRLFLFPVLYLLLSLTPVARASGVHQGTLYASDGVTPLPRLFGSALAIVPGEQLQEQGILYSPGGGRLYLACPEVPESLSKLRLQISAGDPIFDGELGSVAWIYLGAYAPEQKTTLHFTLTVPEDLSRQGQMDWQTLSWNILEEPPATGDTSHPAFALWIATISTLALATLKKQRQPV